MRNTFEVCMPSLGGRIDLYTQGNRLGHRDNHHCAKPYWVYCSVLFNKFCRQSIDRCRKTQGQYCGFRGFQKLVTSPKLASR